MYRVTNSMIQNTMLSDMHGNLKRVMDLQEQLASGRKYRKPSDNPVDVVRDLQLGTTLHENQQYQRNMEDGLTWLKNTETALSQINGVVSRVRELAVYAGNGALEDIDENAIAQEIEELQEELRQTANYSVEGRHLLSGYATSIPPFARNDNGKVVYQGNDGNVHFEMEKCNLGQVSFNGRDIFPEQYTEYGIESREVPLDFKWKGRNEILQIRVGDRVVKTRLPEDDWVDDNADTSPDDSDYNGFRDPDEMDGYTLEQVAQHLRTSVSGSDLEKVLSIGVRKDSDTNTQQLVFTSNTAEPISVTSWQEEDSRPLWENDSGDLVSQGIVPGLTVDDTGPWTAAADDEITLTIDGESTTVSLSAGDTLEDVRDAISDASVGDSDFQAHITGAGTSNASIAVYAAGPQQSFTLEATGNVEDIFGTEQLTSTEIEMPKDHSHISFASLLGMETAISSREMAVGASVPQPIDWYIESGDDHLRFTIDDGSTPSLNEVANRINTTAGEWLEAVVETDHADLPTSGPNANEEAATERLVVRSRNGDAVNIMDMDPGTTTTAEDLGVATTLQTESSGTVFPNNGALDDNLPAYVEVNIGNRTYDVKLYRDEVVDSATGELDPEDVAASIKEQIAEQSGRTDLFSYKTLENDEVALYAPTGEPIRIVDRGFGDPDFSQYTGGIAAGLGIAGGIIGDAIEGDLSVDAGETGSFRVETLGHTVDISVTDGDTVLDIAERMRELAGSWLDVSVSDEDLTADATADARLAVSAKDGTPVSVFDITEAAVTDSGGTTVQGVAQAFGIDNAVRGEPLSDFDSGTGTPLDISTNHTITFEVDGYEHDIDLRQLDTDGSDDLDDQELEALPDLINARFQGQDLKATLIEDASGDQRIVLTSPAGYDFRVSSESATNITARAIFGNDPSDPTKAKPPANRGGGSSPHNQVVTRRTAANQAQGDFFSLMDRLAEAVRNQDRDGISDALLPQIDDFMNNLLEHRTEAGALIKRYETSGNRLTENHTNLTELRSTIADTDIADAITNFQMAQSVYQASLATIAKVVQPTLVDFLR